MNQSAKEALLSLGIALVVFFIFRPKAIVSANEEVGAKKSYDIPEITEEEAADPKSKNAYSVLCAYITAYNAKETQEVLDDMNREALATMGVKVVMMKDNSLSVQDASGKEIMYAS